MLSLLSRRAHPFSSSLRVLSTTKKNVTPPSILQTSSTRQNSQPRIKPPKYYAQILDAHPSNLTSTNNSVGVGNSSSSYVLALQIKDYNPLLKNSSKTSEEGNETYGDDLLGRIVTKSEGNGEPLGVILMLRPPIAYALVNVDKKIGGGLGMEDKIELIKASDVDYDYDYGFKNDSSSSSSFKFKLGLDNTDGLEKYKSILPGVPSLSEIDLINTPMVTGFSSIDALTPIGRGQNLLITSPRPVNAASASSSSSSEDVDKHGWSTILSTLLCSRQLRSTSTSPNDFNLKDGVGRNTEVVYILSDVTNDSDKFKYVQSHVNGEHGRGGKVFCLSDLDMTSSSSSSEEEKEDEILKSFKSTALISHSLTYAENAHATKGRDVIVVTDTLTNSYDTAWKHTAKSLTNLFDSKANDTNTDLPMDEAAVKGRKDVEVFRRNIDKQAESSEMRAFYSQTVQRGVKYNKGCGGGSITLLLLSDVLDATSDTNNVSSDSGGGGEAGKVVYKQEDFKNEAKKVQERISLLINKGISITNDVLKRLNIPVPALMVKKHDVDDVYSKHISRLNLIDDLISMTDGQIILSPDPDPDPLKQKQKQKVRFTPPIDLQKSLTRIGIGAETPSQADAMCFKRFGGWGVRFDLCQFRSDYKRDGDNDSDNDNDNGKGNGKKGVVKRWSAWEGLFNQPLTHEGAFGRSLGEMILGVTAVRAGHLDGVPLDDVSSIVKELDTYVRSVEDGRKVLNMIEEVGDCDDGRERIVRGLVERFFKEERKL